jgi:hypothetical protein
VRRGGVEVHAVPGLEIDLLGAVLHPHPAVEHEQQPLAVVLGGAVTAVGRGQVDDLR